MINAEQGSAQITSSDSKNDTLCFTLDQANYLLKSTEKLYICDSIINKKNAQIKNLFKVTQEQGDQLQLGEQLINAQRNQIERLNKQKKLLSVGLGTSLAALFVFVIL